MYLSTEIFMRYGRSGESPARIIASAAAKYNVFLYGAVYENIRLSSRRSNAFFFGFGFMPGS